VLTVLPSEQLQLMRWLLLLLLLLLTLSASNRQRRVHASTPPLSPTAAATARYREGTRLLQQCCGGGGGGEGGVGRRHRRGPESERLLVDAELAAAAATELDPSRWQHHNLLGEVYLQQQNWDGAAQEFLATTQLDNQVASAFLKLGYALSKIPGYQDKALESRLIAARLNTDFADLDDEWNSRAPARIQPIERHGGSVMVEPPPLAPPLAIVVPYRDRAKHLEVLVPKLSKLLDRQQQRRPQRRTPGSPETDGARSLEPRYRIFVVEQANDKRWNKGIVYNAGFHHIRTSRVRHVTSRPQPMIRHPRASPWLSEILYCIGGWRLLCSGMALRSASCSTMSTLSPRMMTYTTAALPCRRIYRLHHRSTRSIGTGRPIKKDHSTQFQACRTRRSLVACCK
jgi:tetratricopeptide (TPR) repeat protein